MDAQDGPRELADKVRVIFDDWLDRTETKTYCPYKGDASYFSIVTRGARSDDAVWTYEAPLDAVALIKDCVTFYPDRVEAIDLRWV